MFDVSTRELVDDSSKIGKFEGENTVLEVETQETVRIIKILQPENIDVKCGTPLILCIDDFDFKEISPSNSLEYPELVNAYEADLGPDSLVSWQAFLKKKPGAICKPKDSVDCCD